jgi:hypothetical protein
MDGESLHQPVEAGVLPSKLGLNLVPFMIYERPVPRAHRQSYSPGSGCAFGRRVIAEATHAVVLRDVLCPCVDPVGRTVTVIPPPYYPNSHVVGIVFCDSGERAAKQFHLTSTWAMFSIHITLPVQFFFLVFWLTNTGLIGSGINKIHRL